MTHPTNEVQGDEQANSRNGGGFASFFTGILTLAFATIGGLCFLNGLPEVGSLFLIMGGGGTVYIITNHGKGDTEIERIDIQNNNIDAKNGETGIRPQVQSPNFRISLNLILGGNQSGPKRPQNAGSPIPGTSLSEQDLERIIRNSSPNNAYIVTKIPKGNSEQFEKILELVRSDSTNQNQKSNDQPKLKPTNTSSYFN